MIYLVRTEFQKNIHILFVFENMFKVDDVLLQEGFVNFDLGEKLELNDKR